MNKQRTIPWVRLRLHGDDSNENTLGLDRHNTRRRVNSFKNENENACVLISLTTPIIGVMSTDNLQLGDVRA